MNRQYRPENDTDYSELPERYREGMKRYIEERILPGHFLTAMLTKNLEGVLLHIDSDMIEKLPQIYRWIYNEAPSICWGSLEKVHAWVNHNSEKFTGGTDGK